MPNNENNNLDNNLETNTPQPEMMPNKNPDTPEQKPIIEIPQEYYDKLAKEEAEKVQKEQQENLEKANKPINTNTSTKGLGSKTIVLALVIIASIYASLNIKGIFLVIIPVVFAIGSAFFAFTEKKDSTFPTASLIGGIIVAIITFLLSVVLDNVSDIMFHYALLSAIAGFLGLIIGSVITNMIANKEVKALGMIFSVLFLGALVAVPYFAYKKYPETISKFLFLKQVEVKASTEDEFIEKTLKNRYNVSFTCDHEHKKNALNQKSQRVTTRTCTVKDINFTVSSIAYNEGDNQYIVIDNLIDNLYLEDIKGKINTDLQSTFNASKIEIFLYPRKDCTFVGDCADCDEYYDRYSEETDKNNQYKSSTELNLENYLNKQPIDFVNNYEFKVIINIYGTFSFEYDYNKAIDSILEILNKRELRNTFGFNISLLDYNKAQDIAKEVYKVKGNASSDKKFAEYEVLPTDGSKNNR